MSGIERLHLRDKVISLSDDISNSLLHNTNIDLELTCDGAARLLGHAQLAKRERRGIRELFPAAISRDPSWDILLDCFIAQLERRPLCVKQIHGDLKESNTALLRRLDDLEAAGLIARRRDDLDGRRTIVEISSKAMRAMAEFLDRYMAPR